MLSLPRVTLRRIVLVLYFIGVLSERQSGVCFVETYRKSTALDVHRFTRFGVQRHAGVSQERRVIPTTSCVRGGTTCDLGVSPYLLKGRGGGGMTDEVRLQRRCG